MKFVLSVIFCTIGGVVSALGFLMLLATGDPWTLAVLLPGLAMLIPSLKYLRKNKQPKEKEQIHVSAAVSQKQEQPKRSNRTDRYMHMPVNGANYRKKEIQKLMNGSKEYEEFGRLVPEPDNEYDPGAIKVDSEGVHIGYVPKDRQSDVRRVWDRIKYVRVAITLDNDGERDFYRARMFIHYKD